VPFADQAVSFSVAGNVLAYASAEDPRVDMLWFDRSGKMIGRDEEPVEEGPLSLSPDEKSVAMVRGGAVWLLDIARSTNMRVTFGQAEVTSAVWSPDGTRIAFGTEPGAVFQKLANSAMEPELLARAKGRASADSWSRDGRVLLYHVEDPSGKTAIWQVPLTGDRKSQPVVQSDFRVRDAQLSPDGEFLAYVSNESGRDEVYAQAFPPPGGKWQISAMGGTGPFWREDGRECFFVSSNGAIMAVPVQAGGDSLRAGVPQQLFAVPGVRYFAGSPDGRRFLAEARREPHQSHINIVVNWAEDLRL
jgi:Tol biopolymer transport system component